MTSNPAKRSRTESMGPMSSAPTGPTRYRVVVPPSPSPVDSIYAHVKEVGYAASERDDPALTEVAHALREIADVLARLTAVVR